LMLNCDQQSPIQVIGVKEVAISREEACLPQQQLCLHVSAHAIRGTSRSSCNTSAKHGWLNQRRLTFKATAIVTLQVPARIARDSAICNHMLIPKCGIKPCMYMCSIVAFWCAWGPASPRQRSSQWTETRWQWPLSPGYAPGDAAANESHAAWI
jgi:hypothetical protein